MEALDDDKDLPIAAALPARPAGPDSAPSALKTNPGQGGDLEMSDKPRVVVMSQAEALDEREDLLIATALPARPALPDSSLKTRQTFLGKGGDLEMSDEENKLANPSDAGSVADGAVGGPWPQDLKFGERPHHVAYSCCFPCIYAGINAQAAGVGDVAVVGGKVAAFYSIFLFAVLINIQNVGNTMMMVMSMVVGFVGQIGMGVVLQEVRSNIAEKYGISDETPNSAMGFYAFGLWFYPLMQERIVVEERHLVGEAFGVAGSGEKGYGAIDKTDAGSSAEAGVAPTISQILQDLHPPPLSTQRPPRSTVPVASDIHEMVSGPEQMGARDTHVPPGFPA